MVRPVKVLILLALVLSLLCGCSPAAEQTITCQELTITLPASFTDLSSRDYAAGMEFLYGSEDTAILAITEDNAALKELVPDMDAQKYAELFVQSNALDSTVEVIDGIPSFTYTMDAGGTAVTYLCGVFESSANFWMIQAYCPATEFSQNQETLWSYLTTVTVQ